MPSGSRTDRSLPGGHETDWDLLSQLEDVLAERADSWDDGSYQVTIADEAGERRVSSVAEGRSAVGDEGVGNVRRTQLEADGSSYSCTVSLTGAGGSVVVSGDDETAVEDLADRIERTVRSFGPQPSAPETSPSGPSGADPSPEPEEAAERGGPGRPPTGLVVGVAAVSLAVVVITALITGEPVGETLTRPWVITVVGGLVAILISWHLRSWFGRSG